MGCFTKALKVARLSFMPILLAHCSSKAEQAPSAPLAGAPYPPEPLRCSRADGPLTVPSDWPEIDSSGGDYPMTQRQSQAWRDNLRSSATIRPGLGRLAPLCATARRIYEKVESAREAGTLSSTFTFQLPPDWVNDSLECAQAYSDYLWYQHRSSRGFCSSGSPADGPETQAMLLRSNYEIGLVHFRLGNYDSALTCFDTVPNSNPLNPAAEQCRTLAEEFLSTLEDGRQPDLALPVQGLQEASDHCPSGMAPVPRGSVKPEYEWRTVDAFCLDLTEVTLASYRGCAEKGECPQGVPLQLGYWRSGGAYACNWGRAGRDNHPMNCVSADMAAAYCAAQGKRLPTETEWIWATRGPLPGRKYPWGDDAPSDQLCWSGGERPRRRTCAVGRFERDQGPFGHRGLAGNVSEWTLSDSSASSVERLVCGGNWRTESPEDLSESACYEGRPSIHSATLGFRCAK